MKCKGEWREKVGGGGVGGEKITTVEPPIRDPLR